MPASELIERVADLLRIGASQLSPETKAQLEPLQRRLREPVRVAVVGRVNSGKSTMVNALLGQRVAPTDVSECTRLVTWFRYGHPQRVEVELRDGTTVYTQLGPDGMLPAELPVPPEDVLSLHCYLANDTLRSLTLIDTPGIGSVHANYSASTTELLTMTRNTVAASNHADAVVLLFSQAVMADDLDTLGMFTSAAKADTGRSAASAVGVLTKADQLGDGDRDPWEVASELAATYAGTLLNDVATVVPAMGLLAETTETGALTEADVNQLATLAALEARQTDRMLWSADRFVGSAAPVSPEERERLLALLDLYGLAHTLALLRGGTTGAVAVRNSLSTVSGISQVKRALDSYFREHDHVLKARSVLDIVDRMTYSSGGQAADRQLAGFRGQIEALRLDPVMHPVAELEVWHECCTGRVDLPAETLDELRRLFAPGTAAARLGINSSQPEVLSETAKQGLVRWQKFLVTDATPAQAKVARVVRRSYQILWSGLQAAGQ